MYFASWLPLIFQINAGVSLPKPCPTRWNSKYDALLAFFKAHKSLKAVNDLFAAIGITALVTKEDMELLNEYILVLRPLAQVLDVFQGEKNVFLGIGIVLPLITMLKKQLDQRVFPNLGGYVIG